MSVAIPAHLSIHDVAPETLEQTGDILDRLIRAGIPRAMLLVIPGKPWKPGDIEQLRSWCGAGHVLAGHGWHHRVKHIHGPRHRLYSLLLSRDMAEHLACDAEEIASLIRACYDWFESHNLPSPDHYVPPAWAMGPISRNALQSLPFRSYESLGGVYDAHADRWRPMPVVGYEADTLSRQWSLRGLNAIQRRRASVTRPLRVSIHPHDFGLRLRDDLEQLLESPFSWFADLPDPITRS